MRLQKNVIILAFTIACLVVISDFILSSASKTTECLNFERFVNNQSEVGSLPWDCREEYRRLGVLYFPLQKFCSSNFGYCSQFLNYLDIALFAVTCYFIDLSCPEMLIWISSFKLLSVISYCCFSTLNIMTHIFCYSLSSSLFFLMFISLSCHHAVTSACILIQLVLMDPSNICLVPFVFQYLNRHSFRDSSEIATSTWKTTLFIVLLIIVIFLLYHDALRIFLSHIYHSYYFPYGAPSLGIWWYLDIEVLSEFAPYFTLLRSSLPWIVALPLMLVIGDSLSLIGVIIMNGIVLYFRSDVDLGNLLSTFSCLIFLMLQKSCDPIGEISPMKLHVEAVSARKTTSNHSIDSISNSSVSIILSSLRARGIIVAGMIVPLVLYPWWIYLWISMGTGNPNYLFFNGLLLWIFLALYWIELLRSTLLFKEIQAEYQYQLKKQ